MIKSSAVDLQPTWFGSQSYISQTNIFLITSHAEQPLPSIAGESLLLLDFLVYQQVGMYVYYGQVGSGWKKKTNKNWKVLSRACSLLSLNSQSSPSERGGGGERPGIVRCSVVLKLQQVPPHLEGLWKHRLLSPTPASGIQQVRMGPRTYTSNKFPRDADTAGPGTTHWKTKLQLKALTM